MFTYLITYGDGGTKTVQACNITMALQSVEGPDFITSITRIA
jgi:hypothetical protein